MSFNFRKEFIKRKKAIMEKEGLSEADWSYIMSHIGDFCAESDSQCRIVYGESCNVDQQISSMYDDTLRSHIESVIKEVFERLGYVKEKEKKKKKKSTETKSETKSETTDEKSEEQVANELEEEQQTTETVETKSD